MRKKVIIAVLGMLTPTIGLAEPATLTLAELDSVTAGAVSANVDANALAIGPEVAETVSGAVTGAVFDRVGDIDLGVALGLAVANAVACCDGAVAGAGTSASGVGDIGFGANLDVSFGGANAGTASHLAVSVGGFQ